MFNERRKTPINPTRSAQPTAGAFSCRPNPSSASRAMLRCPFLVKERTADSDREWLGATSGVAHVPILA